MPQGARSKLGILLIPGPIGSIFVTPLPYQDSSDMTGALHGHYPRKPLRRGIPKAVGCRAEDTCVTGFPDLRVYVTAKHCWLPVVHRLQGLTGDERSDTFSERGQAVCMLSFPTYKRWCPVVSQPGQFQVPLNWIRSLSILHCQARPEEERSGIFQPQRKTTCLQRER